MDWQPIETAPMTPSKEAIEAVFSKIEELEGGIHLTADMKRIIKMGVKLASIDFAALQQENEQLRIALDLVSGALVDAKTVPVPDDVMRYGESVRQIQQETERLRARVQDWESTHQAQKERAEFLQQENERNQTLLRELAEALRGFLDYEEDVGNFEQWLELVKQSNVALARAEEVLK